MIYWLTGQPAHGKTVLGKKLQNFLQSEQANWKKHAFHLDGDDLRELTINKDYSEQGRINNIRNAQMITEYLHNNNCDVVVSLVAPYKWLRDEFKERMNGEVTEIYVHTTEARERDHFKVDNYEAPTENFIDIDTTTDSPDISFVKLLKALNL
jgi:adenylylsulfate kinase